MQEKQKNKVFRFLVCGGTFDHFHKGHEAFLTYAFSKADTVLIGLTSDEFARKKDAAVESYVQRLAQIKAFLALHGFEKRGQIEPIDRNTIPLKWLSLPLDAILVTEDSLKGAEVINTFLKEQQKPPLEIVIADLSHTDMSEPISSSAIRAGSIDKSGKQYVQQSWLTNTLILPDSLRAECQKIFGTLLNEQEVPFSTLPMEKVITVGDVVTKTFLKHGYIPRLSVIDFIVERQKRFTSLTDLGFQQVEEIVIANPAGSIQPNVFSIFTRLLHEKGDTHKHIVVRIDGEEDLSVLPAILCAPLGFMLFYGQPSEGVVMLTIDDSAKKRAAVLLSQFELRPIE